jgi:hypothetical protein
MIQRHVPLLSLLLTAAQLFGGWKVLAQLAAEAVEIRFIEVGEAGNSGPAGLGFSSTTNPFIVGYPSPSCAAEGESPCLRSLNFMKKM